jgi:hypothetical protein
VKQLIAVPTETRAEIVVEVEAEDARPTVRGGSARAAPVERATTTFEESIATIAPVVAGAVARLSGAAEGISEVTIKFGLKFTAGAGVFIASVGSEATFEIGLKWTDPAKK